MTTSPLLAALADFQAKPPTLTKNKAGHQSKYADLVQVNEQVLARLNELGIVYTCAPTLDDDGKFVLAYELTHVASGEKLAGRYPLKLAENPQQMGSAITYARRYVLLALTGVAAEDEDDDGQAASGRRTAQRAQQNRPAPAATAAPERATAQRSPRPAGPPLPGDSDGITPRQQSLLHVLLGKAGKGQREAGLGYISDVLEREITTTKELSKDDAKRVIDHLQAAVDQQEQQ
ncbi:ERF family protein [Micromonospora sp. WMMC241]|uniref:ERF family protein n=1 Tax=Micromonospora sp. WMMC241 TaxID=3015159 RepID=UPI0022B7170D|nr:ERF family protein [Micromonospora sp. WMMC241]MCZ7434786.1 ERF family protein [Micromonospora sp. WMMC241]MCZ7440841.1 ERF family protein [Micromonospora sp. WMMC241]MCZ7440904.1 ERF family protein [Micromonospora sp. WMMC241]